MPAPIPSERNLPRYPYFEQRRMFVGQDALMPDVVIPQTELGRSRAARLIKQRVADFQTQHFQAHPEQQGDSRVQLYFKDMRTVGFWHILTQIDGPVRPEITNIARKQELRAEGDETRAWAVSTFSRPELETILGICVDTALLGVGSERGQPGFKDGHSTIYEHLFEKPGSMFTDIATPALRKRLQNGRFWEELPDLRGTDSRATEVVQDVLGNHFDQLDPQFFLNGGYAIFERNGGVDPIYPIDLSRLSKTQLKQYLKFVKAVDRAVFNKSEEELKRSRSHDQLSPGLGGWLFDRSLVEKPDPFDDRVAHILDPFVHAIHSPDPGRGRRFTQAEISAYFADPFVEGYVANSDVLRNRVARDLTTYIAEPEPGYDADYAALVISCIPRPREMASRLIGSARNTEGLSIHDRSHNMLTGLEKVLRLTGLSNTRALLDPHDNKLK